MRGHGADRHLRFVVTRVALHHVIRAQFGLAVEIHRLQTDQLAFAVALGVDCRPETAVGNDHAVGVVNRHRPLGDAGALEELLVFGVFPECPDLAEIGVTGLLRADPDHVLPAVGERGIDAGRCFVELQHRHDLPGRLELEPVQPGMQEHGVHRVHRVFTHLQPVARIHDLVGHQLGARQVVDGVIQRELRHIVGRPHVGEQQAVPFDDGVGTVASAFLDLGASRLAGRVQNGAVHRVMPAVVAAADAVFCDKTELQRRVAMAAVQVQQAVVSRQVAKCHQVLTQDTQPHRHTFAQFLGHAHWLPEAAQVLAAWLSGADLHECRVGFRAQVFVVPDITPARRHDDSLTVAVHA